MEIRSQKELEEIIDDIFKGGIFYYDKGRHFPILQEWDKGFGIFVNLRTTMDIRTDNIVPPKDWKERAKKWFG